MVQPVGLTVHGHFGPEELTAIFGEKNKHI